MKKLILIVLLFGSLNINAQSRLKVTLDYKTQITVEVDGKHFQKNGTSITVGDLPGGRHTLRIFEFSKNRNGRVFEDLVYEGRVKTTEGNITIFELDPETGNINVYDENLDSFYKNPVIITDTTGGVNAETNNNQMPASITKTSVSNTFTEASMNDLKARVDDMAADSYKMKAMKAALAGEKITTEQAGKMLDWFVFESSKEEFAEWVYNITVDKENYINLEAKFTYENYRVDFENFMKKQ